MNSPIFETEIKRLNRRFALENRKVLLLMDNCACHGSVMDLELSCIKVRRRTRASFGPR